ALPISGRPAQWRAAAGPSAARGAAGAHRPRFALRQARRAARAAEGQIGLAHEQGAHEQAHMSEIERQRIDKWLVYARVVKSRSQASKLVAAGHVRVNRDKIVDPARTVKPGDVLTVALDRGVLVWRILALGDRRGPAVEARLLYE